MISATEPTLQEKVDFLRLQAFADVQDEVIARETHMSWVFLAGDAVYKLKKPVCFPYLDFSTLARREAACRSELRLNRRLAPTVYIAVVPLCLGPRGLSVGGTGIIVDWLVVMRRLDEQHMLDSLIRSRKVNHVQLHRLTSILVTFYKRAAPVRIPAMAHLRAWHHDLSYNRAILLHSGFSLPVGAILRIDNAQRRFLAERSDAFIDRIRRRKIVDAHGDLRPEHIWLGDAPLIIDCLEFNPRLRAVDPFDELAYLSVECDRLGAAWVGDYIARALTRALSDGASPELFSFYRCYRATMRARLAIAHLLDPNARTPDRWPRQAGAYLQIADREARRLLCFLRTRAQLS